MASWLTVPLPQLKEYVNGSVAEGLSFSTMAGGSPSSPQGKQFITALQRAGYSPKQIQSFAKGPSELQQILDQIGQAAIIPPLGGGVGGVAGTLGPGESTTAGGATIAGGAATKAALTGGSIFAASSAAVGSSLDFLKLIAWIFHPRNILRAVEFVVGIILMVFGFHAALQARGERLEGFTTSEGALTRSGLGRVATALGQATRGGGARPASAPHVTRRRALAQRYTREERVRQRERKGEKPAGHAGKTKGSGAGTKKAVRVASRLVK